jgi:hypothetical protein
MEFLEYNYELAIKSKALINSESNFSRTMN